MLGCAILRALAAGVIGIIAMFLGVIASALIAPPRTYRAELVALLLFASPTHFYMAYFWLARETMRGRLWFVLMFLSILSLPFLAAFSYSKLFLSGHLMFFAIYGPPLIAAFAEIIPLTWRWISGKKVPDLS
jgi:hypothetical protein